MKLARATISILLVSACVVAQAKPDPREDAYRANNLGVALLEQFKNADAVTAFQRGATILRVHDVKPTVDALTVAGAIA